MLADIQRLSVAERIQLVEDIWDTIARDPDALPVTDVQCQELRISSGWYKIPDSVAANSFIDQAGDIKLEASSEYRFPIYQHSQRRPVRRCRQYLADASRLEQGPGVSFPPKHFSMK